MVGGAYKKYNNNNNNMYKYVRECVETTGRVSTLHVSLLSSGECVCV